MTKETLVVFFALIYMQDPFFAHLFALIQTSEKIQNFSIYFRYLSSENPFIIFSLGLRAQF